MIPAWYGGGCWLTTSSEFIRNNYAAARLQGLEDDLNMTDQEYQIGLSTLFVGYVLMQVPSNALLNYAGRPSWYIGFFVCLSPQSTPPPQPLWLTTKENNRPAYGA